MTARLLRNQKRKRRGTVIIGILVIVTLVSLAAYSFTSEMEAEHIATRNAGDHIKAEQAARSGIEAFVGCVGPKDQQQSEHGRCQLKRRERKLQLGVARLDRDQLRCRQEDVVVQEDQQREDADTEDDRCDPLGGLAKEDAQDEPAVPGT